MEFLSPQITIIPKKYFTNEALDYFSPGSNILLNYLEKTSEHHIIPEYTYLPLYLYQLKHSNL